MHPQPGLLFIVENDYSLRTALHRLLSAFGWEVRLFGSSYDCFQAALDLPPACILIDLHPAGMNAVELQEALRSGDVNCPMVILTPHVDSPLAATAKSAGAYAVLEKACDASKLDATLRRAAVS
jgi:FixJ family two-component response regulator